MAETFNVTKRADKGRQANKRLRRSGQVPAVLYGHGEASVSLAIKLDEVTSALKHSSKRVALAGEVTESALIREVQWDAFGIDVLHVDLMRVSDTDKVEIKITLELRGEAAGVREGGIVNFANHEIEIECPVAAIPEHLYINIANLHLGAAIHAGEVELPQGATLITDKNLVIVNCVAPHVEAEGAVPGAVAEPELIRKAKEEGAEEEKK
jgi:large subunit ribosomal protein L25